MKTIQLNVEEDLASKLNLLSEEERKELTRWIGYWVYRKNPRPIWDVISEVSEYAKKEGLTPEALEKLLNEKD